MYRIAMTLFIRLLVLGLFIGLMACTPSPETETKPVAPSTPAPEDRRYNPEELAFDIATPPSHEELDA